MFMLMRMFMSFSWSVVGNYPGGWPGRATGRIRVSTKQAVDLGEPFLLYSRCVGNTHAVLLCTPHRAVRTQYRSIQQLFYTFDTVSVLRLCWRGRGESASDLHGRRWGLVFAFIYAPEKIAG